MLVILNRQSMINAAAVSQSPEPSQVLPVTDPTQEGYPVSDGKLSMLLAVESDIGTTEPCQCIVFMYTCHWQVFCLI